MAAAIHRIASRTRPAPSTCAATASCPSPGAARRPPARGKSCDTRRFALAEARYASHTAHFTPTLQCPPRPSSSARECCGTACGSTIKTRPKPNIVELLPAETNHLVLLDLDGKTGLAARLQNQVGHAQLAVGLLDDLLVHRLADLDLQLLSLGIVVFVFIVEFRYADPAGERSLQNLAYFFFFFFPSSSLSLSYFSPS